MQYQHEKLPMASQRLEALGDGIFAVAMTILVIELKIPYIEGNHWQDFANAVRHSWLDFLCYAISFIVTGIMWFGHRMMFEFIGRTNRYFIFLGVLFYMVVCLVPFSTKLLAAHTWEWYAILVYGLNLSLCNLTLYAQWSYGIKRQSLLEREVTPEVKHQANFLFLISPVVYSIAIICSFWLPAISIVIFVATPLLYILPNKIDKYLP
jgi:uncharacterized membrane protein